jgi:hypothetical protein
MNDIIVWDNCNEMDKDARYTLLYGNSAFIFGETAKEDHRNIEKISKLEVNREWMDDPRSPFKKILSTDLPATLIEAIKKRA